MSLVHFYYDPLNEFDCLLDDAFTTRFSAFSSTDAVQRRDLSRPRMDIHESKEANSMTATFELPGVKADDITIDVHQNRLMVAGEARYDRSNEEGGYAVRERRYGKFSRTLQLPFGTKPDDVKAKMENGILTVMFPKTTPEQHAQRISVQ